MKKSNYSSSVMLMDSHKTHLRASTHVPNQTQAGLNATGDGHTAACWTPRQFSLPPEDQLPCYGSAVHKAPSSSSGTHLRELEQITGRNIKTFNDFVVIM